MRDILSIAKAEFRRSVTDYGQDPYQLLQHVAECEKWARFLLRRNAEADAQVVLLSVWLHDIGHYPVSPDVDHAVRSTVRAETILRREECPQALIEQVLLCVRAHRRKDVMPQTLEANILVCADCASHLTDTMYFSIARDDKAAGTPFRAYAKLERDIDDLKCFPEIAQELSQLGAAWRLVLQAYESIDLSEETDNE